MSAAARQAHIKLDMRNEPPNKTDADYPAIVFRTVTQMENQVQYVRERVEIELIGLQSSETTGEELLEQLREAVMNAFAWQTKTWGKFTADGTPDPTGGLRLQCSFVSKVEGFNKDFDEKVYILLFFFTYLRP
jgi:hypothetical protein